MRDVTALLERPLAWLAKLGATELIALEASAEGLLRAVRGQRTRIYEAQLQSAHRRQDEASRGREALQDEQACVICSEASKTILFMPCRHLCVCDACALLVEACPICRASIEEKVQCLRP